jgi:pilus assembly protein CpaD
MTFPLATPATRPSRLRRAAQGFVLVALAATAVAGCRPDGYGSGPQVAGWSLIDPAERHPILVSQSPVTMSIPVRRGSYGLSNASRDRVARFLRKYRATDAGNSKLVISAPSGRANDVAGMQVVSEVRDMIADAGFPPSSVHVEASPGAGSVRLSYLRVVAKAPECGLWPTNLAREPANVAYPNFGCATQHNFAEMVANPADLLGPRSETPRLGDRRTNTYKKYVEGDSTTSKKSKDERVSTQKSE